MRTLKNVERQSIGAMHDPRLRWLKPLSVTVERSEGRVVLWSHSLQEWGVGETFSVAVDDLVRSIAEGYWFLSKLPDAQLSTHLQRIKRSYQRHLGARN